MAANAIETEVEVEIGWRLVGKSWLSDLKLKLKEKEWG